MGVRRAPGPLPLLPQRLPPHRPPLRQRVMGSHTTSAVCSAGRKMRSLENSQPFPLFFMPIPTFPISNRTTQVNKDKVSCSTFIVKLVQSSFFSRINTEQMFIVFLVTDWASRCKQIMKIWRKVSAADKVPYLVSSFFLTLKNNTFMFTGFSLAVLLNIIF